MLKTATVTARSIDEAHFQLIRLLFQTGWVYVNKRGSFIGHKRLEYDHVTIHITHPHEDIVPNLPQGVPPVTTDDDIVNYAAKYLLNDEVAENELYTYGEFIVKQLDAVVEMLKATPDTNQAVIAVGNEDSITQEHPPCLRIIDCRVKDGKLHFIIYFRSWDLWGGLPENLGGLQLLQEHIADLVGIKTGEMICQSKGLHLYDYSWPSAFARLAGTMPENSVITKAEAEEGDRWMSYCGFCKRELAEDHHSLAASYKKDGSRWYFMMCDDCIAKSNRPCPSIVSGPISILGVDNCPLKR